MAKFDIVYDDFTGGHFMGANEANQPRNTWTGPNVICTADQGFLMADSSWSTNLSSAAYDPSQFSPPTIGMPVAFEALSDGSNPTSAWYTNGLLGTDVRLSSASGGFSLATLPAMASSAAYVGVVNGQLAFVNGVGASSAYLVADGGGVTTVTTSANFGRGMWWWNNFAIGVSSGATVRHRLWHSAPANPASWPALNYYDIGDVSSPITTVIPTNDALYIGKTEGWWVLTGVLGETAVLRRLTRVGVGFPAAPSGTSTYVPATVATESRAGIMFRSDRGPFLNLLRGTQVDEVASFPYGIEVRSIVPSATDIVVACPGATAADLAHLYVWSDTQRRWRHRTLPMPTDIQAGMIQADWFPVTNVDARSDFLRVISNSTEGGGGNHLIYDWQAPREPLEPTTNATGFDSATVTLAEYHRDSPFRVHELVVEIDYGQPVVQTFPRGIAAWVNTDGHPDLDQAFALDDTGAAAKLTSSPRSKVITTATNTRRGHRQTIRFGTNDGAPSTFTAAPVLAMTGVKVRRVIMKCETV